MAVCLKDLVFRFSAGRPAEWIETTCSRLFPVLFPVSPLEDQRSGLKPRTRAAARAAALVSPLEDQRSGLKHRSGPPRGTPLRVSPLEDQRSGLKPHRPLDGLIELLGFSAGRPAEWIETWLDDALAGFPSFSAGRPAEWIETCSRARARERSPWFLRWKTSGVD